MANKEGDLCEEASHEPEVVVRSYETPPVLPYLWKNQLPQHPRMQEMFDCLLFDYYPYRHMMCGGVPFQDDFGNLFAAVWRSPWYVNWEWVSHLSSCASMYRRGTFPPGMSRLELEREVVGTFGGNFVYFNEKECTFAYLAYTD